MIKEKIKNDAIVDGLSTMAILDQFLRAAGATDEGRKNIAMQHLLNMKYDKQKGIDVFIEDFRSLAIEAEHVPGSSSDKLLIQMMMAKLSSDETYANAIENFRDLSTSEQTLDKLIKKLRAKKITQKEMNAMKTGSMHLSQHSNSEVGQTLFDRAGNAYSLTSPTGQANSHAKELLDSEGRVYLFAQCGQQGPLISTASSDRRTTEPME